MPCQAAIDLATLAIQADIAKDHEKAISLYVRAADELEKAARTFPQEAAEMRAKAKEYRDRANVLTQQAQADKIAAMASGAQALQQAGNVAHQSQVAVNTAGGTGTMLGAAAVGGVAGAVLMGPMTAAVAAGCKFSPAFAKATIPSTRVALAISPPLFAFFLAGDLQIHRDAKNRGDVATARSGATWPLQLANAFYNHTLIAFGMIITPMYGAILHSELSKPRYEGWRLSHAVIHTRVYGQAAAVGSLVLVFGFKDILRQNGAPFKV